MELLCEISNHSALITQSNSMALNALSLGMLTELKQLLRQFAVDPSVHAVVIKGAGEKAFCAGGDIRALYESFKSGTTLHFDFFRAEYPLDYLLRFYPKPYIALIDGIAMGGGMGVAQGARWRVVGDRTRMAMPEVAIGFFPDVGASYFLSRLPGSLGAYLALTGAQIRAADTLYAGLADLYVPTAELPRLEAGLASLTWPAQPEARQEALAHLLRSLTAPLPPAPLATLRPAIDEHFGAPDMPRLIDSLAKESRPAYAAWAKESLQLLRLRSPIMLEVALRQLQQGQHMSFAECLRMELGMAHQTLAHGDFIEGIRALVIDKDNAPRWSQVSAAAVDEIFRSPWPEGEHPLRAIEREIDF